MKIFIETERLILREIIPEDVEGMYALDSDTLVHRYLGNRPIQSKDEAMKVIDHIRQQYLENGIGRWAMVEKQSGDFIGWSGLKLMRELTNNHINHYDLGYRLIRTFWGQGFATESALATLEYGFDRLQLQAIFAMADIENTPSNKILTKVGFHRGNTFLYDNAMHHWYEMDRDDWENRTDLPLINKYKKAINNCMSNK